MCFCVCVCVCVSMSVLVLLGDGKKAEIIQSVQLYCANLSLVLSVSEFYIINPAEKNIRIRGI